MAGVHLALSSLGRLEQPEGDAHRLFLADALLEAGWDAEALLKALDLDDPEPWTKYNPNQPRVPAGRGRASGQWTSNGGGGGANSAAPHRPPAAPKGVIRPSGGGPASAAAAVAIGPTGAGLDLGAIGARALAGLAAFITGLTEVSAAAAAAGVAAGAGLLLIPSTGPRGKWVYVGGPGKISYFFSPDQPGITFRYTGADGKQRTWSAGPDGPDHGYRGPDGQTIARWVKAAGKVGLVISLPALIGVHPDEPEICPSPSKGDNSSRGRAYEDFVKAQFNPGKPTPSGFGYNFFNPLMGKSYNIDDCKWQPGLVDGIPFEEGVLAEYKGPGYAEHLLKLDAVWENGMRRKLDEQARRQWESREGRSLTWFVEEKPLAEYLTRRFSELRVDIRVIYMPFPEEDE